MACCHACDYEDDPRSAYNYISSATVLEYKSIKTAMNVLRIYVSLDIIFIVYNYTGGPSVCNYSGNFENFECNISMPPFLIKESWRRMGYIEEYRKRINAKAKRKKERRKQRAI